TGEVLEGQLSYWRQRLGGGLTTLELPTDRPRPAVQTYRGAHHAFTLTAELSEAVREFSQQHDVTLFMTLLAAWQALLHRYTGQEDVVVGTDIANRNHAGVEDLIGFFVNQLVLRTDLSGEPGFTELVRRVREVALGAYAHQDVPFERLVNELQPERDLSRAPLFQVKFALQNAPVAGLQLPDLEMGSLDIETGSSKFDLMLTMVESGGRLAGSFEYSTDLFDATTIERMQGHFEQLLHGLLARPDDPVATLDFMTEDEKRRRASRREEREEAHARKLMSARRKKV
ncbi:MAG TPA: condensation domain-containing protein, partial [Pyrinomonadaceae bacterium]